MKTNKLLVQILPFLTFLLFACQNQQQELKTKENDQNLIVLIKYKTLASKSEEAMTAMTKLIEAVKSEPYFIKIIMHSDPKDPTTILLYEEWSNEFYYNEDHMQTDHLKHFIEDSRAFLAGPPEITQWKIVKEINSR